MDMLYKAIQETVKDGIGQAIIAFSAWIYVIVLLFVAVYYTILCVFQRLFQKED